MIMTEDEAKTKWCPQSGPHEGCHHPKQSCIGSACMAWRREMKRVTLPDQDVDISAWTPPETELVPTDRGFCGLARNPS